ncbi:unnamed protein product [Lactuca saligna]|uniref:Uncharacterized protein n=1 Tax=Lactuca saligna TaxID=75948 RepID=A0AA35VIM4_LACSI|nr:unnamed protein product [Lactuca saligna]
MLHYALFNGQNPTNYILFKKRSLREGPDVTNVYSVKASQESVVSSFHRRVNSRIPQLAPTAVGVPDSFRTSDEREQKQTTLQPSFLSPLFLIPTGFAGINRSHKWIGGFQGDFIILPPLTSLEEMKAFLRFVFLTCRCDSLLSDILKRREIKHNAC